MGFNSGFKGLIYTRQYIYYHWVPKCYLNLQQSLTCCLLGSNTFNALTLEQFQPMTFHELRDQVSHLYFMIHSSCQSTIATESSQIINNNVSYNFGQRLCITLVNFQLDAQNSLFIYTQGPVTGHLDTGFSWFPWIQERMLRWFPPFQVSSTCFSCSPPDLNPVVTNCLLS